LLIPTSTSGAATFFIWCATFFWLFQAYVLLSDLPRLWRLHNFFKYLLDISDSDIQTVSWQDVVAKLMALRDQTALTAANQKFLGIEGKERMDAHDIANRLMRKENYMIALFNKEILDVTLPIPFLKDRPFFSHILEWNLQFCIDAFVFGPKGEIRPMFLKHSERKQLISSLRTRFLFAGFINVILAPFIISYSLVLYFFRYSTVCPIAPFASIID
jgi:autophagy-related protein 9